MKLDNKDEIVKNLIDHEIIKLKSSDLEDGLKASGSNNKYQYFLMFIIFFLKIVTDSFYGPLPYFFMDPKIRCYNEISQSYTRSCKFYDVCKNNNISKIKYKIDENLNENFSWVTGFNIYCDSIKLGLLASSASIGNLLSNVIGPLFTENIGRIKTITIILILDLFVKSAIFFTKDISFIFAILLMINFTNNTIYNTVSLYLNEMIDSKKRGLYSCIFNSFYGISGIIYTIVFNFTFNWKILQMVSISASFIALILNFTFLRESIRYSFLKGKIDTIIYDLKYIANFNGRSEQYEQWKNSIITRNNNEISEKIIKESGVGDSKTTNPISLIFENKQVIYNFLTFCIVSLVTISGIIYNAIEIKTSNDIFLYPIIFYFTDFVIILGTGFIIELPFFGRKVPAIFFSVLGGIFYLVKYFSILKFGDSTSIFWIDYITRLSVGISFNILIEYNFEIYSTDIRATAYNINKLFSRAGDFTIPLILSFDRKLTTAIMGGMYLFMSIIIVKLRETRGVKLKESVNDETLYENEEIKMLLPSNEKDQHV